MKELRTLVETSYQQGFNIVYVNNFNVFTDEVTGTDSTTIAFNENESSSLGSPVRLFVANG